MVTFYSTKWDSLYQEVVQLVTPPVFVQKGSGKVSLGPHLHVPIWTLGHRSSETKACLPGPIDERRTRNYTPQI
jgi:hypothetical protein